MKYWVTVVRYGWVPVEAESAADAMDIADHQTTDTICWSEDWSPTDAEQDDGIDEELCIKEKAFE